MRKQVRVKGWLSTSIRPPCFVTMPWHVARPRPTPFPGGLVVKNGSKMRGRIASGMPGPLSQTSMTMSLSSVRVSTVISPLVDDRLFLRSRRCCWCSKLKKYLIELGTGAQGQAAPVPSRRTTLIPSRGKRFTEHHETLVDRLVDVDFAEVSARSSRANPRSLSTIRATRSKPVAEWNRPVAAGFPGHTAGRSGSSARRLPRCAPAGRRARRLRACWSRSTSWNTPPRSRLRTAVLLMA